MWHIATMARFLFLSLGSSGDIFPFLGIANTMKKRQHDCIFLANEVYQNQVASADIQFDSIGSQQEFERHLSHPDLWHPRKSIDYLMREIVIPAIEPSLNLISKYYVPGETVLVSSTWNFSNIIANEVWGIPTMGIYLQPRNYFCLEEPYRSQGLEEFMYQKMGRLGRKLFRQAISKKLDGLLAPVNDIRLKYGLKPVANIMDDWRHGSNIRMGLWPTWFQPKKPSWPNNFLIPGFVACDGYTNKTDNPWLEELSDFNGKRPILFTLGTGMTQGKVFFKLAAQACEQLDIPGILITTDKSQIPSNLPINVKHLAFAPFLDLAPRCSIMVHHGGIGSVGRGIAAGIPQLAIPLSYDQFDNGHNLKLNGIGDSLPFKKLNLNRLTGKLASLLNDKNMEVQCRKFQTMYLNQNPMAEIVSTLEGMIDKMNTEGASEKRVAC